MSFCLTTADRPPTDRSTFLARSSRSDLVCPNLPSTPLDINECEDPTLSSFCVENAECCNLPGYFVCKCRDGYEGNGTQSCRDVDECASPDSCGRGALCTNKLGSFECECPQGFTGDPMKECWGA